MGLRAQSRALESVGRVGTFTLERLFLAVPITAEWQAELATQLQHSTDPKRAVDKWADEVVAKDDRFVRWHAETALQATMAGQLMVRAIELEDDEEPAVDLAAKVRALKPGPRVSPEMIATLSGMVSDIERASATTARIRAKYALRAPPPASRSFFGLPYRDAVEFFRAKEILTPEEFDELTDRFRASGFTARALATEALRERAHAAIVRSLEEGTSVADIVEQIRSDELALGMSPASHDALDTIVRTNVATAYGAGKFAAYTDPDVATLRPYLMYVTAGDGRVRPAHQLLDGKVFEARSDLAAYYAPPLGYRCRCSIVSLSERQLTERGLTVTRSEVEGADPDEGFSSAPEAFIDIDAL